MSIAAADLRKMKKAICDALASVTGIGEVLPSRMSFASREEFWATVSPKKKQKALETGDIAFVSVSLKTPRRRPDPLNDQLFHADYAVRMFREGFPTRVDETETPDAFAKKLYLSEDEFDAALINAGLKFAESFTVGGLSQELTAVVLPVDAGDVQAQFGSPEWVMGVDGHYAEFTVTVEAIYDDC